MDSRLLSLVADRDLCVLATLKRDGRPQLSHVNYAYDSATSVVRVSLTDDRAKVKNLRRDPRASVFVSSEDGWSYTVLEGKMELSDIAAATDDDAVDELVDIYRLIQGEHPDWDEYRQAMVADKRLVGRLAVVNAYGSPAAN